MKIESNRSTEMGNCIRKDTAIADVTTTVYESPSLEEICPDSSDDMDLSADENINYNFHIYLYQKYMQQSERELVSWCSSKLALTEDIIRINRSRLQRNNITIANESANENIHNEIEQLKVYRKKLMKLIKHLKKMDCKKLATKRLRKKRSHKCAVKLMTALTDAVMNV